MRGILPACCLFLALFALPFSGDGQMVGDNVFLQGHYVEIGIAPNGGYGSTLPAPAGYHPYLGGASFTFWDPAAGSSTFSAEFLGFVADYGADGWTVGTPPFFGDFYLPGQPQEGWAIKYHGSSEADAYIPSYMGTGVTGFTGSLAGTNTGYINTGATLKGIWQGTDGALAIRQTTVLDTGKLYFTVNVVIKNTSLLPVDSIYYIRTVDPDNDETRVPGEFTTINTITYQLPDPGNKVLVSATGVTYTNAYLGLGTKDCRAKCVIFHGGGLIPGFSPDTIYNQLGSSSYLYVQGTTSTDDVGIGLAFNVGTIGPGDSTSLSYAYVLNAAYIDSALDAINPGGMDINGSHVDSTDTIDLCSYTGDSVLVSMPGGGFYHWTWRSDSFVAGSGTSFVVHSDSITTDVVYTVTGTNNAGGCDSTVYHVIFSHNIFTLPPITPTYYCQNEPATPLIPPAGGSGALWYNAPTGGVGNPTAPTPLTTIPGSTIYYVTETFGLCQSLRAPDTVNVKPLPPPPFIFDPTPYCYGQPFEPFTTIGAGITWYTTASGGVGNSVAPVINTSLPGNDTVYASQTVDGCEGPRGSYTITVLNLLSAGFSFNINYGCHGDTVTFTNSSIGAHNYVWAFGDGQSDTSTSPVHIFTTQDSFRVKLTSVNAHCFDSAFQEVKLIHPVDASFTFEPAVICQHDSVVFTNTSTDSGQTYVWLFGNGAFSINPNTQYTYQHSGVYDVQLIASNFIPCHDTAHGTVIVDSLAGVSIDVTDSVLCRSSSITFTGNYTSSGNTGVTWQFGDGDSMVNVNPIVHSYDRFGTDTVTVTAHFRACPDTSTQRVVSIFQQPAINLGPDTAICAGNVPITLADLQNTPGSGATWLWNTGARTSSIVVTSPGYYSAQVNINGCVATDTVWVKDDCYLDIPNVFTPNGDGLNDYFFPRQSLSKGLTSFRLDIYNRWGQLIFETEQLDGSGWDGKFNDIDQPEGVYVYVIEATFKDGQKEHHQGNLTLLR